jgi:hypothetical protein
VSLLSRPEWPSRAAVASASGATERQRRSNRYAHRRGHNAATRDGVRDRDGRVFRWGYARIAERAAPTRRGTQASPVASISPRPSQSPVHGVTDTSLPGDDEKLAGQIGFLIGPRHRQSFLGRLFQVLGDRLDPESGRDPADLGKLFGHCVGGHGSNDPAPVTDSATRFHEVQPDAGVRQLPRRV